MQGSSPKGSSQFARRDGSGRRLTFLEAGVSQLGIFSLARFTYPPLLAVIGGDAFVLTLGTDFATDPSASCRTTA
jgi:hypothetical protein